MGVKWEYFGSSQPVFCDIVILGQEIIDHVLKRIESILKKKSKDFSY